MIDWGGGAVDPVRGIFTVNTMGMPFRIRLVARDSDALARGPRNRARHGPVRHAPRPADPHRRAEFGRVVTAGFLVFIGATTDQYLRAFDLRSGRLLWRARLSAGAQATRMTYQGRDGRQHLVNTAGGHGALGTRYGDNTIAFALPPRR